MGKEDDSFLGNINGHIQLLSAALSASISGTIIVDWLQHDKPIIYCNKAFEEMTGYSREEILGRNCRFLQGRNREQIGRHKLREAFADEKDCNVELVNYRKDGTVFFNELYVSPIRNETGIVTHYIGVQNDITIRKQKEISLQLELANAKALQQQKDEFTTLASHELRTPLTSLRATQQLINRIIQEEHITNDRLVTLSKNAERHTKKLNHLVDDLLITTVLPHENLPLNKTTFTVSELMESCCTHLMISGACNIVKMGDQTLRICADQHKIDQVMTNLIGNAVKYGQKSTEIRVEVEHINSLIKVSVTDKGSGITAERLPDIFLRYKKANDNLASHSGLGLGLYICSEIIRRHGGEIGVESELGQGSKFWFTLPFGVNT